MLGPLIKFRTCLFLNPQKTFTMNKRITKLIIAFIILFMPFYSCQQFFEPAGTEVIKIVGVDSVGDLILKDTSGKSAKVFEVKAGTKIKWQIKTDKVSSIENIYKKTTPPSDNIFSSEPKKIVLSRSWKATVDSAATDGQFIEYNIDWKDNADSIHTYDPRIQVKS